MRRFRYYVGGSPTTISFRGLLSAASTGMPRRARAGGRTGKARGSPARVSQARVSPARAGKQVAAALHGQKRRLKDRFWGLSEEALSVAPVADRTSAIIPTESVSVGKARSSELRWAKNKYGMAVVQEGRNGKVLLKVPSDAEDGVGLAFKASEELYRRGNVESAHPNFLRVIQRPVSSTRAGKQQWALNNPGKPGLIGADVHALATWTMTKGIEDVRVAVLDEGVDTLHPYLKDAIADEADFVDKHTHARPDGNDAHGTACAGIIASRNSKVSGLAPGVMLVAVRIAKSDNQGYWIFDDFDTADAIDWAWDEAEADVLSNSWGGGPEVDIITRAFERARTKGRRGKGCVVVAAAGNEQSGVSYPGTLADVLTVGASNQWDERKTKNSKDGEIWWGSNFGQSLDLLAPGVAIVTTDIRGRRGYSTTHVTADFNGTSAATPFAAAAAALMLSLNPAMKEERVRELINAAADPIGNQQEWNRYNGHGRLNAYMAARAARRG